MKKNKILIFNKYIFILLVVFAFLVTGATYSYLAYTYQNNSVIKGNVVSVNADLKVELVKGSNTKLVPLSDDGLTNAINGTGGEDVCVDANGNLSCQIYKITLTNKGSRITGLKGIIKLYTSDSSSKYTNLSWRELSDLTTVKDGSFINGMKTSILVSNLTMESKEVKTWYIAVYIKEVDSDQTNTDKGKFGGTVTFTTVSTLNSKITKDAVMDNIKSTYVSSSTGIDFSSNSSDTNGKGLYIRNGTENDSNPIYYYRGDVTNNNVLFAGYCWKIVRTTETGGTKLIYNGTKTNGSCNNTGTNAQIGTSKFNSSYDSPAYVGYMYGNVYTASSKSMSSITDSYYYGNDVTYSNGTYTLTDTITSNSWSSIYNTTDGIYNHHYTCLSTSNSCSSVYYVYYTSSSTAYYITLSNGKKVEDALSEMLDNNTTDSTIKTSVDSWYKTNIENTGFASYLEDTIFCNDRSISQKSGWDPDGGNTTNLLDFGSYNRASSPSLTCSRDADKFTTSTSNGNGKLTYPVGLLTLDEVRLGGTSSSNSSYYLYSGSSYWLGAPSDFHGSNSYVFSVASDGYLVSGNVNNTTYGVRPSISLRPGTEISAGDGSYENPYVVQ